MSDTLKVAYNGPFAVDVPDAGLEGVAPGDQVDVPVEVAHRIVAQAGWEPVGWTAPAPQLPDAVADLVDGTIDEVLKRVGKNATKARAALEAEQAKGDRARKSLTTQLSELANS